MHAAVLANPPACGVGARDVGHSPTLECRRARASELHVRADADAQQATLRFRAGLLLADLGVAERGEGRVQRSAIVSRLIGMTGGGYVWHLRGRDEIDAAHLGGIKR